VVYKGPSARIAPDPKNPRFPCCPSVNTALSYCDAQMGEEAHVDAPQPLLKASIEAMCRVADSMKVRRSELTTDDVLARVDRLIEQAFK
jgi:hypothetical protein